MTRLEAFRDSLSAKLLDIREPTEWDRKVACSDAVEEATRALLDDIDVRFPGVAAYMLQVSP